MIHKKQTFTLGNVTFKVDPKKPTIQMTVGGITRSIKKKELWAMVFSISKKKDQDLIIPIVQTEMVPFVKQVWFKATKDIKAGETAQFHIKVDIPLTIVQAHLTEEEKKKILASDPTRGHDKVIHTEETKKLLQKIEG